MSGNPYHPDREDWGPCQWPEEECPNFIAIKKHGLCNKHYRRLKYLEGLAEGLDLVQARDAFWSHVDVRSNTECWPWKDAPHKHGHGVFPWKNVGYHAHIVAYRLATGLSTEGKLVDHKCRNRVCVNPLHLQAVTAKENTENLSTRKNSASGYRGVTQRENGKWRARVGHEGKILHIGQYDDPESAAIAVREARLKLHTNNLEDRGLTYG